MFSNIAKVVARNPAVAVAGATAAANAAQGSVQARAPPQGGRQAANPPAHSKIVDRDTEGWVLAELKDEVVLFQPFNSKDVDEAAGTVMALWGCRPVTAPHAGPIITEIGGDVDDDNGSSTGSSCDDRLADAVIEAAAAANADARAMGRVHEQEQLKDLMNITTRMLRRPGMQREVVVAMLEDPEIRQLMLGHCNDLDRYLVAAGAHNPILLPSAETVNFSGESSNAAGTAPRPAGPTLVTRLVGAVAGALERAGDRLASLAGWLRRQLKAAFQPESEGVGVSDESAAGGSARGHNTAKQVLGSVMILAVAVFCVMVFRKPLVLRGLRRC